MNSLQLANILKNNSYCKDSFIGVYPSNKIPHKFNHFPVSFIVNTDKKGQPGCHRQAIFIPNNKTIEFYDSFGHHPPAPLNNLMRQFPVKRINRIKLQNNYDISCGPFVIFFLYRDAVVDSLRKSLKIFIRKPVGATVLSNCLLHIRGLLLYV